MKYEVEVAKSGELTLKINGLYAYSKYAPKKEAYTFIEKEFEEHSEGYILIGLGLGYHLEALLQRTTKKIIVVPLEKRDVDFYRQYGVKSELQNVVLFSNDVAYEMSQFQVLLPGSFLNAIGENHTLYEFLQDIKIRQRSFKGNRDLLEKNFTNNISLQDPTHLNLKRSFQDKSACLVSAGPSLDSTISDLKLAHLKEIFIISVGSALKTLLYNDIMPDAVIITDGQDNIQEQLKDTGYSGPLYYLCTANNKTVAMHVNNRVMLLQKGYPLAEELVEQQDLLETGGSVATTAFSLLEYMGFITVFLFGQDLGFRGEYTHSINSTSTKKVYKKVYKKIEANDGAIINTQPNLYSYLRWFEQKFKESNVIVYNMSKLGAKIKGTKPISSKEFIELI